jgi:hypothetical protein
MKSLSSFIAITSEGGLLPADFLHELPDPKTSIEGVTPVGYHLAEGERLNEQINRSWHRLKGCWENFKKAIAGKELGQPTTTDTRERWLLPLFQELGFGRVTIAKPIEVDGRSYPVSHGWNQVPIHLVGSHADLDGRTPGAVGAAKASPHSLVQSALNASDDHLWGILSNGLNLRLLRDNITLTRLAYVEFDLQAMFDGDLYSEFFVLWLVCHQSRFEGEKPAQFWLERWKKAAEDKTLRALDDLYPGVQKAIAALGAGLVSHRANGALLEKLRTGRLTTQEFYKQVLRVIYRMLFLLVAEDRALLHLPDDTEAALKARRRYRDFYSLARLRGLSRHRAGTPHPDLWHVFQFVTAKLGSDTGCSELALPPLGSFLWTAAQSTPDLLDSLISNRHFLEAIHALAFVQDGNVRRTVDYKNLGSEELGSVYQGLLEMHPRINADAGSFELDIAAGNERKTSGSYYTPDSLVQCLLDSALEPVIAERLAKAKTPKEKETALLSLKVCDKAVGSGHFLLRAAHRIARHLARVRSGEEEPSPSVYRTALRDVIGHCLYGVDINPMAVELCKVTLWLEALEPGKPLSFLDHHIRCGNSLLGATPELIRGGIPDEAYEAIEGDDKEACAALKKKNKRENPKLGEWFVADEAVLRDILYKAATAIDEISDNRPEDIRRKEAAFHVAQSNYDFQKAKDLADLWCAAFVIKKHFPDSANFELHTPSVGLPAAPAETQAGLFGGTEETAKTKKIKAPSRAGSETAIGVTTQHLREFVAGGELPEGLLAEAKQLADQYQFFHFHLAFPEVIAQGGFDVSLGNPPWEQLEQQSSDHIDERTFGAQHFIEHSAKYPFTGTGRKNLYGLFAELATEQLSRTGRIGLVLPTGMLQDLPASNLAASLMEKERLVSAYDFENRRKGMDGEKWFRDAHPQQRFCLLTIAKDHPKARFVFDVAELKDLNDTNRFYFQSAFKVPMFKQAIDARIATEAHKRGVMLGILMRGHSPVLSAGLVFNAEPEVKRQKIAASEASGIDGLIRVYEGTYIHQFDHRLATFQTAADRYFTTSEKCDPDRFTVTDTYLPKALVGPRLKALAGYDPNWILVLRRQARATDSFISIGCIIPFAAAEGNLSAFFFSSEQAERAGILCAEFNSFTFNFLTRLRQGGANLNKNVYSQLPIVDDPAPAPFLSAIGMASLRKWVLLRVLELTYTAWDLEAFAQDCGWSGPPFRWDEERRFLLRCELDAAFFHLYLGPETDWRQQPAALTQSFPTPRAAVSYILDTFPIVKRKDEKKFNGDYRTKRVILEIYDALAEAQRTGTPYQTRLDPPPADARCCHPRKKADIPAPVWMDRPLVLPASRRVAIAPDRYRAAVVPHLLYQSGGSLPFERFRKAYWLLSEPKTLARYATGAVGKAASQWSRSFGDTLEKDMFIPHLKEAVGRQLHFISKDGERWLELRDPKIADDEHVIFDARLALFVADIWPVAEPIMPLTSADEIAIQQLEAVL